MFPWQKQQWQHLVRLKHEHSLPHALLLTGLAGTGKVEFANSFTHWLLCQTPAANNMPCLQCHHCRLITGKTHPNVLWITSEKKGQAIKVDQIRYVTEFINQSALQGDYRIVIIHPANAMNINAANALLKTLEEPSTGSLLILISDQLRGLPATILSRCQRIIFPSPHSEEALPWLKKQLQQSEIDPVFLLKLANGAPCAALQFIQDDVLPSRQKLLQSLFLLHQKQGNPVKLAA